MGFGVPGSDIPQLSINRDRRVDGDLILHIRGGRLHPGMLAGLPATGPDRTFVDCATQLSLVELVEFGDHLLHCGATTLPILGEYVQQRHLDGVQRARLVLPELDARAESPMESLVRMCLALSGLPPLVPQVVIEDRLGQFVARVDLLEPEFRVIVEYDGRHHELDSRQRQRDRERHEQLDALGYRMIVITSQDVLNLSSIPHRVYAALRQRGYPGAPPMLGSTWRYWLASPRFRTSGSRKNGSKGTGTTKC